MERNCSLYAAADFNVTSVDIGVASEDVHTAFSQRPEVASNAFMDFLFLMDSTFIVRSGSSFSATVCSIKGLTCQKSHTTVMGRSIEICFPASCLGT